MPSLFEQTFGGDSDEDENPGVTAVALELDDEDVDEEFRLANLKMKKAQFYRVIVDNGVVEDNGTAEAAEVNNEAKAWARRSMLRLLKGENPGDPVVAKVESPFSPDEVTALKQLVKKAMAMGMVEAEKPAPTIKKVAPQPAPPTVRKVQTQPPPPKRPGSAPPAAAAPQQPGKPKKPPKVKPDSNGQVDYDLIPSGEVFKDQDGRLYKMVDNPRFDPDVKGSKPRTKISVNTQSKTPGRIPMPMGQQLSAVTQLQAMEAVNMGSSVPSQIDPGTDATSGHFIHAAAAALTKD